MLQNVRRAIELELKAQRRANRSLWISIDSIESLDETPGRFVYQLELSEEIKVVSDSVIKIKVPGYADIFKVQVLLGAGNILIIVSEQPLPQQMALVRLEFDPAFILEKLDEHLDLVLRNPPKPLRAILERTIPPPETNNDAQIREGLAASNNNLNDSQLDAVIRMQSDDMHLLWGPPGTGKTHTLGASIAEHLRRGKSCLLLSTSNAAVDQLVKSLARVLGESAQNTIFRAGISAEREVDQFTHLGYFRRENHSEASIARQAQHRLNEITSNIKGIGIPNSSIFREIEDCKNTLKTFAASAKQKSDELMESAVCVAATLANLVINNTLSEREFDVVYIDESSMVSLAFAFAGAAQATEQVIFAGDFRQLPPICHSDDRVAREWFAKNIFDFLNVTKNSNGATALHYVSMLRQQYRMTESIAIIVSDLSYGGKLESGDGMQIGTKPIFIDVSDVCASSYFSVQESSYYQPYSAILLYYLKEYFGEWLGRSNLLLSPFRSQRSLLQAIARDISTTTQSFSASTIHKSQGSQDDTVLVDLTAHSTENPQKFFTGEETENLINVALSRAQNRLLIFGNLQMIRQLKQQGGYWQRFYNLAENRCTHIKALEIIVNPNLYQNVSAGIEAFDEKVDDITFPSVYVEDPQFPLEPVVNLFSRVRAQTKLMVLKNSSSLNVGNGITYRQDTRGAMPAFAISQGLLCLPISKGKDIGKWIIHKLPETTKKLNFIACGHLLDSQVEAKDTLRLHCIKCSHSLILKSRQGIYRLVCSGIYCGYTRPLNLTDAKVLIEAYNILCPECQAKGQPRASANGSIFIGCSNYPRCQGKPNLSLYSEYLGQA